MVLVRKAAQSPALDTSSGRGLVDIVARYAQTFLLLQRYDEGLLTDPPAQPGGCLPSVIEARAALDNLKAELMARGEATDLFARDRGDGLASLMGNLDQSVFGQPAYPTVEAKAAHLLYFVVKNHPFSDGNKRSAAFLFVDFLHRNDRLLNAAGEPVINDVGLAALTLLVAESNPANKETMIRLIMSMLAAEAGRHAYTSSRGTETVTGCLASTYGVMQNPITFQGIHGRLHAFPLTPDVPGPECRLRPRPSG